MSWWNKHKDEALMAAGLLSMFVPIPGAQALGAGIMGGAAGAASGAAPAAGGMLAESVAPVVTEKMAYMSNPYLSALKIAGGAAYKAMGAMGTANQAMNMAQGPQQAPPPPPPPNQFQATPVNPAYGMSMDTPPAGIDPRQWAMMTEDQKRRFKGGV